MAFDPTVGNKLAGSAPLTIAFPRHEQTFPMLTPAEIARMRRFGDIKTYKPGEKLFETGKPGPGMLRSPSAMASVTSPRSSIRAPGNSSPKSGNSPAVSRWSMAMSKAMSKRF